MVLNGPADKVSSNAAKQRMKKYDGMAERSMKYGSVRINPSQSFAASDLSGYCVRLYL